MIIPVKTKENYIIDSSYRKEVALKLHVTQHKYK